MTDELNLSKEESKQIGYIVRDIMRLIKVVNPPIRRSIKRFLDEINDNIIYDENLDYKALEKLVYEKVSPEIPEQDRRYIRPNLSYIIEKYYSLSIWEIDGKLVIKKR